MSFDEHMVVAQVERLNLKELRFWVRQGWLRPAQGAAGPVFDELDIARIRLLCDLRKEMSLPNNMMPVVLSLVDQLHQTRRGMRALAKALAEQPAEVRHAVVCRFQEINGTTETADDDG